MAGCPLPFASQAIAASNEMVNPTASVNQYSSDLQVWLDFPQAMDQTVIPSASHFNYIDASSNVVGQSRSWVSETRFQINFTGSDTFDPPATLQQSGASEHFKTLEGDEYDILPVLSVTGR